MSATTVPVEHLPRTGTYHWVGIWSVAIRAMHWSAALAIVVLAVTGMYIGTPYFLTSGEASSHFLMGWMRMLHFIAAAVLVMTAIVRIYWLFAGNRYERWSALFPYHPRELGNIVRQAWSYLTIRPDRALSYLGHNPLSQVSYTGLYAVAFVQVCTGFALYGQYNEAGVFYRGFNWIGPLLGGMPNARFLHHEMTWLFAIFVPIHIYLAIRADILEHGSIISAMVSGGRMVPADATFEDD